MHVWGRNLLRLNRWMELLQCSHRLRRKTSDCTRTLWSEAFKGIPKPVFLQTSVDNQGFLPHLEGWLGFYHPVPCRKADRNSMKETLGWKGHQRPKEENVAREILYVKDMRTCIIAVHQPSRGQETLQTCHGNPKPLWTLRDRPKDLWIWRLQWSTVSTLSCLSCILASTAILAEIIVCLGQMGMCHIPL